MNAAAAGYVDGHVASFAHKISVRRILRAVDAAVLRHDPELAAERAERAAERRGVWVEDRLDGTSEVTAVAGTPDAVAFDQSLDQVASVLGALGDTDPRQVPRAKALGVLADPQYALDLTTTAESMTPGGSVRPPRPTGHGPTIHVHLHTDALTGTGGVVGGVARVERFGPRTLATVHQWLADLTPGATVRVTPVIDLTEPIGVDSYEIPDRLRAQVTESTPAACSPGAAAPAPSTTSTPGSHQIMAAHPTTAAHRARPTPATSPGPAGSTTASRPTGHWRYRREPDQTLTWTSPLHRTYRVDPTGTTPLC